MSKKSLPSYVVPGGILLGVIILIFAFLISGSDSSNQKTLKNGVLEIQSIPSGADVYINGKLQGDTPFNFDLPSGIYSIRLSLSRYQSKTFSIQVQPKESISRTITLKAISPKTKESPNQAVESIPKIIKTDSDYTIKIPAHPAGARVKIDGKFQGTTPLNLPWVRAHCQIRIEKRGFSPFEKYLTLKPGINIVDYSLTRKSRTSDKVPTEVKTPSPGEPVQVRIAVSSWAEVSLDGKSIGEIPPVKTILVLPGKHSFEFKKMDKIFSFELEFKFKEDKEIYMNMETGKISEAKK